MRSGAGGVGSSRPTVTMYDERIQAALRRFPEAIPGELPEELPLLGDLRRGLREGGRALDDGACGGVGCLPGRAIQATHGLLNAAGLQVVVTRRSGVCGLDREMDARIHALAREDLPA